MIVVAVHFVYALHVRLGGQPRFAPAAVMRVSACLTAILITWCIAADAQSRVRLPTGVVGVSFGTAQSYKDVSGKEMCAISQPLADPLVFPRGVTEISYAVHLQARAVKSAKAQIVAPGRQGELLRQPCDAFTLVKGGFSQTQLGSTISRPDKKPLSSGTYKLRITVDGESAEIPFEIAR